MAIKLDQPFDLTGKKIWIAGHRGLVGSSVVRRLAAEHCEILTATHDDLDLTRQSDVEDWLNDARPDAIIISAATVGGILANQTRPAEFLYDNLMIETNILHAAYKTGIQRALFLGTACIYPRDAAQPMAEDALLTGPLEPTNQWYAIAKIAGIKMCQAYREQYGCDFISAQPNNLYGPGDNFDLASSHVIPALMSKAHTAKIEGRENIEIWGTGTPIREFLYIDDLADALVFLLQHYKGNVQINIGTGDEVTIRQLAETVARVVGYDGGLVFDADKPDGAPRKLLDVSLMTSLGWTAHTKLEDGLKDTYDWYMTNVS